MFTQIIIKWCIKEAQIQKLLLIVIVTYY